MALIEARKGGHKKEPLDELTAISMGVHPEQLKAAQENKSNGKVSKGGSKNSKRNKKKQMKAEAIKDMLEEKINSSKQRHTSIRKFRQEDE